LFDQRFELVAVRREIQGFLAAQHQKSSMAKGIMEQTESTILKLLLK
jgi:hypothetical protein